jgi:subtilase family protein
MRIAAAKDCGALIFNSVGNLQNVYKTQAGASYDLSQPWPVAEQQVSVSAMIADPNLLNVGGAWWAQRHDLSKSPRTESDLSASRYSMGYSLPPNATAGFTDVETPQICGLGGPAFDQLADVEAGGLNVVPVIIHDALSKQKTQQMLALSGTSIATPQVCGVAALVLEAHAGLDVHGLRQTLLQTTREIPSPNPKDPTRSFTKPDRAGDILDLPHGGGKPGMVDLAAALTYDQTGLTSARQVSAQRSIDALVGAMKPDRKS